MHTSVNQHINDVCHKLRVTIIKNLNHRLRKSPELYVLFKKSIPTDPLALETSHPLTFENACEEEEEEKTSASNFNWSSFVAVFISIALNAGIYTLYTREAYRTGLGLLFLVPYTVVWLICAKPFLENEIAQGQNAQSGPFNVFSTLHPRTSGMGFAILLFSMLSSPGELFYSGKLLWYTVSSLTNFLPWDSDFTVIQRCASIPSAALCSTSSVCYYQENPPLCVPSIMKLAFQFYLQSVTGIRENGILVFFNIKIFSCMTLSCVAVLVIACYKLTLIQPRTLPELLQMHIRWKNLSRNTTCVVSLFGSISSITIYTVLAVTFLVDNVSNLVGLRDFIDKAKWTKLITDTAPWLSAFVVVLSSNDIIRGAYYILGSYTRRGTSVLHGSLVCLSAQLYVGTITTLVLANSNARLSSLILSPQTNVNSIFFTQAEIFPFILFPVCVLFLPGPPLFSILIFLFLWVQSLIKLVMIFGVLGTVLRDSKLFVFLPEFFHYFIPFIFILLSSIPYVLNISSHNLGGMSAILMDYVLEKIAAPCLGILQICMFESIYGWTERQCILSFPANYIRIALYFLHLTMLCSWAIHFYAQLNQVVMRLAAGCLFLFLLAAAILSFPSIASARTNYMLRFFWWTIGGVNCLRNDINNHIEGVFPSLRNLSIFWSLSFGLACPFILLLGLIHNFQVLLTYSQLLEGYNIPLFTFVVLFCVIFPVLVVVIFPKIMYPLFPSREWQATYEKLHKKHRTPQFAMRRIPCHLFEEFQPIEVIWRRAYELRYTKIF